MGTNSSIAYGINNNGQVVGLASTASGSAGPSQAFLYSNGVMCNLGTLPGYSTSEAMGINNNGQVAGYAANANYVYHAFLYSNGVMADLGTLGGSQSFALGLNDRGDVALQAQLPNGDGHACLYSGGKLVDLNTLIDPASGWTLIEAANVNNLDQIVGYGTNPSGQSHAFLLNPVSLESPRPQLAFSRTGANLVISWPINPVGYSLYRTADLSLANWMAVTNAPVLANDRNQVVIPGPFTGRCFYRLQAK